jgi:site-specific DNA recombinase
MTLINQIFEWSAAGHSLKAIAGLLNNAKVPPPQKRADRSHPTWCPTAVRAMLRRELYIGKKIWNQTKFVKTPGTNKRVSRPRPRSEWNIQELPGLRIVSDELWVRVQKRQERLKEVYGGSGPISRAASSPYLLSGFLLCGSCGAKLTIVSGSRERAKYGCPQHRNRRACTNAVTIRSHELEQVFFRQLQEAILTPEAIEYLVDQVGKVQRQKKAATERDKRRKELGAEIEHLVSAITTIGHSDALVENLRRRETELRELAIAKHEIKELTPEDIREQVLKGVEDIPRLMAKSSQTAKAKLAQHVDKIRLLPLADGSYHAEGEWDLLGERGPEMVGGQDLNLRPLAYEWCKQRIFN